MKKKLLPDLMKTFIIKLSMRLQDLDAGVLAENICTLGFQWLLFAEMKRVLRLLAKLPVPPGIQQLDIPGLCLDGPSVEIVGFSLDCVYI